MFLLVVALLLPGKEVPLYRHELRIVTPEGEQTVEIKPCQLANVSHEIRDAGVRLVARPGKQWLNVFADEGKQKPRTIRKNSILPLPNGYTVYYTKCVKDGSTNVPRYKLSTTPKWGLLIASILLLLVQAWTYWRFTQLS